MKTKVGNAGRPAGHELQGHPTTQQVDRRRRLALVADDPDELAALAAGLGKSFNLVAKCASGEEALRVVAALPKNQRPHLVLLDIKMPGMGRIRCCLELRRLFSALLIAMHTAKPAREHFEVARLAGADAYVVKGTTMDQLAEALRHLERHDGQCLCIAPMEPPIPVQSPSCFARLTACDRQIMELVHAGLTIKEMAAGLNRHEQTVKKHLRSIRTRLGSKTVAQALALWVNEQEGGLQK